MNNQKKRKIDKSINVVCFFIPDELFLLSSSKSISKSLYIIGKHRKVYMCVPFVFGKVVSK